MCIIFLPIPIYRYALYKDYLEKIETGDGDLCKFSKAYNDFGIHIKDDNSVRALEWAPGAQELFLTGDFSEKLNDFLNFDYSHSSNLYFSITIFPFNLSTYIIAKMIIHFPR